MPLRLAPEVQAIYDEALQVLNARKYAVAGNKHLARKVRREISALYHKFEQLQLPPPEPTPFELREMQEDLLTLEDRIVRIEQVLKIGKYADDYYD